MSPACNHAAKLDSVADIEGGTHSVRKFSVHV